ncbi:MAG: TRAP transporter small permease subunit [Hyphomicrobiales bacterium]
MGTLLAEAGAIITAFFSNDSFIMLDAARKPGAWLVGFFATLIGAFLVLILYRKVPFLERHFERSVMVYSYLLIAGIIFVEVFRRFLLNEQAPWSTTLPPFLFLIMTWFGCAYNVKLRTHLAFTEFRTNMPRKAQIACLCLDALLWFGFCWIVIVTSTRITLNAAANFQILLGTDNVLQWWFLTSVPIAFMLLAGRVLKNLLDDFDNYKSGAPLIERAVIGGDA